MNKEIYITKSDTKFSPYIEDGQLTPAKYIECYSLNMDGKRIENFIGIYPIKAEHLDVTLHKTHDGTNSYYEYHLNEFGRMYLESLTNETWMNYGWWTFELIDNNYLKTIINEKKRLIEELQNIVTSIEFMI